MFKPLKPIYRDGRIHNNENQRPALGCECYVINARTGEKGATPYKLENILVHGGRYDSYILRNVITGKTRAACLVYAYAPNLQ